MSSQNGSKTNMKGFKKIGNFSISSGGMIFGDPALIDRRSSSLGVVAISNVRNGKWTAYTKIMVCKSWGKRYGVLYCVHENHGTEKDYQRLGRIGVDAGMAGMFDLQKFPIDHNTRDKMVESFGNKPKTFNYGVLSPSGVGDGSYEIYGSFRQNKLVKAAIIFLTDCE